MKHAKRSGWRPFWAALCAALLVLLPLLLLRPFSGSAAMAALADLFESHGPDSGVGYTASVLMGSSETIFYEVALYFGAVGVRRTRFAVPVSLAAMAAGVLTALLLCR